MEFHAHLYWQTEKERQIVLAMRPTLKLLGAEVGNIHDVAVGPHVEPMYQVKYTTEIQEQVEHLLTTALRSPILLHESIKDDYRDHTENVRWLNKQLELKLEVFENTDE
jgi:DOPA 4,5-dioxygenase